MISDMNSLKVEKVSSHYFSINSSVSIGLKAGYFGLGAGAFTLTLF